MLAQWVRRRGVNGTRRATLSHEGCATRSRAAAGCSCSQTNFIVHAAFCAFDYLAITKSGGMYTDLWWGFLAADGLAAVTSLQRGFNQVGGIVNLAHVLQGIHFMVTGTSPFFASSAGLNGLVMSFLGWKVSSVRWPRWDWGGALARMVRVGRHLSLHSHRTCHALPHTPQLAGCAFMAAINLKVDFDTSMLIFGAGNTAFAVVAALDTAYFTQLFWAVVVFDSLILLQALKRRRGQVHIKIG